MGLLCCCGALVCGLCHTVRGLTMTTPIWKTTLHILGVKEGQNPIFLKKFEWQPFAPLQLPLDEGSVDFLAYLAGLRALSNNAGCRVLNAQD
eukprot:4764104-Amphidinium_carterae.1